MQETQMGIVLSQQNFGSEILLAQDNAHLSLLHLRSGALGIVYGAPVSPPGRESGPVLFRTSSDDGNTWSSPVVIDPVFAVCRASAARVLRSGRIVVPLMNWFTTYAGGGSREDAMNSIVVSW